MGTGRTGLGQLQSSGHLSDNKRPNLVNRLNLQFVVYQYFVHPLFCVFAFVIVFVFAFVFEVDVKSGVGGK